MKSLPDKIQVIDDPRGYKFFSMDWEMFDAIYKITGYQSKKYRIQKKKVKEFFNKALRDLVEEISHAKR